MYIILLCSPCSLTCNSVIFGVVQLFSFFLNEHNVLFNLLGLLCAVYQWENGSFSGDCVVCGSCLRCCRTLCLCVVCVIIFFLPLLISRQNRRVSVKCAFFLPLYAGLSNISSFVLLFLQVSIQNHNLNIGCTNLASSLHRFFVKFGLFCRRMSCQTSPAQSQQRRCPPRHQKWRERTEAVRALRCRLPRGPGPYQWVR